MERKAVLLFSNAYFLTVFSGWMKTLPSMHEKLLMSGWTGMQKGESWPWTDFDFAKKNVYQKQRHLVFVVLRPCKVVGSGDIRGIESD